MTAAMNTLKKNDNNNKCDKCNQRIHPNFIGYHKCGYANCAICKDAITNSEYWSHIRSHPGHENDSPPPPRTAFGNRPYESKSTRYDGRNNRSISKPRFDRDSADKTQLQVGKEYEVDITQIGDHGDGIARIQGRTIFVRGGNIGERVNIMITEVRSRIAIARTTYSNAAKAGFIAVRRPFVSRVLSNLSEQEIISLAEYVAKAANKDAILLIEREYTIKSAFDFLESWIKISGYSYRHEETDNGQNKHSYVIQHDMEICCKL